MNKAQKIIVIVATVLSVGFIPLCSIAGDLEPSAPPTAGTMHSLDDIYTLVENLDNKVHPAPVEGGIPKTGQTASCYANDDGYLQNGISWPSPRFAVNGDGTVTDNLTGLVWLQDAHWRPNGQNAQTWQEALDACNTLADGTASANLTDGSTAGDWRLPNIKELFSLFDHSNWAFPDDFPFINVPLNEEYWSSTTYLQHSDPVYSVKRALQLDSGSGGMTTAVKIYSHGCTWPVRDAN